MNESKCIDLKKLCDGKRDCIDGGDEGPGCKDYQCRTMNGGCSHKCFVAPGGMLIFHFRQSVTLCSLDLLFCVLVINLAQLTQVTSFMRNWTVNIREVFSINF